MYTPRDLAKTIIEHYKPSGRQLDPCLGDGAFFDQLKGDKDWCELVRGRDFLRYDRPVDWIISNPPWSSSAYRDIAAHAFALSSNVVFLIRLHNALGTYARHRMFLEAGHRLKEILVVPWPSVWRQEGFILAAIHWQRGWTGKIKLSHASLYSRESENPGAFGRVTGHEPSSRSKAIATSVRRGHSKGHR